MNTAHAVSHTRSELVPVNRSAQFPLPRQMLAMLALLFAVAFGSVWSSSPAFAEGAGAGQGVMTVNINTADAQTLAASLKGVGVSRAQEIVRHREAFGPFASMDELTEVKGIGQSTLEANRQRITLE